MSVKHYSAILLLIGFLPSVYAQSLEAILRCAAESDSTARLACYDEFAAGLANRNSEIDILQQRTISAEEMAELEFEASTRQRTQNELIERGVPRGEQSLVYTPRFLSSDGPNTFGMSGTEGLRTPGENGERTHAEFNISIKYPLQINSKSVAEERNHGLPWRLPERSFFIYNGSYDFHMLNNKYLNNRKVPWYRSAPVISRDQNPGFASEWDLTTDGTHKLRLGLMHHSNGQTKTYSSIDDNDTAEEATAKLAEKQALIEEINRFSAGEEGRSYALENLSRASNYVNIRYQWILGGQVEGGAEWQQLQLELRPYYFGVDDELFWEPLNSNAPKLTDFDGLRAIWEHYDTTSSVARLLPNSRTFIKRVELKTGISDPGQLDNASAKVSLGWKWNQVAIVGYWWSGYGKELSSYHYRSHHWGIGLELR